MKGRMNNNVHQNPAEAGPAGIQPCSRQKRSLECKAENLKKSTKNDTKKKKYRGARNRYQRLFTSRRETKMERGLNRVPGILS